MSLISSLSGALKNFKLPDLNLKNLGSEIVSQGTALLKDVVKDSFTLSNKSDKTLSEDLSLNILGNNITLPNPATALANKLLGKANDFLGKEGINVDFKQLLGNLFHLPTEAGGNVQVPGIANRMGDASAVTGALSGALAQGGGSVQASAATGISSDIAAVGGGTTSTPKVSTATFTGSDGASDAAVNAFGAASDKMDQLMGSISSDMSPADLAKVQAQMQKYQQMMTTLSDLMKKRSDIAMGILNNLR